MSELTPNEKAATYIGWRPYQRMGMVDLQPDTGVPVEAPDMTRPENYMRAVEESLVPRLFMVQICEGGYDEGDPFIFAICTGNIAVIPHETNARYEGSSVKGLGDAAVAALAALYDKTITAGRSA